ncbi:MAG TPA: hypothetical protein VEJ63_12070, partial [Planctomycetota bacterium]|nr:hypothetical protein [Planctomycetota bacterium]
QKLLGNALVKKEVEAEAGFQSILVSEMKKVNNAQAFDTRIKPLLDGYLKKFGDTKFSTIAQASVEAYGQALKKGTR